MACSGGGGIGFQKPDSDLQQKLIDTIRENVDGHLNCIPIFLTSTDGLTAHVQEYCRNYTAGKSSVIKKLIPNDRQYGEAGFTRFYADFEDKRREVIQHKIDGIKSIWEDRNVYLIEGEFTRCGVGNDLFDNVKCLKRVICPATNAFDIYDKIYGAVIDNVPKEHNTLVLCVLGPTATVLALDLHKAGYQAIDMGHVDIEYEWFMEGTEGKAPVPGKAVNERGGNNPDNPITTEQYNKEILLRLV